MFTDETERRDWIFGIIVTAVVIGGLYWIRNQPIEREGASVAPIASSVEQLVAEQPGSTFDHHERVIVNRRSSPAGCGRPSSN